MTQDKTQRQAVEQKANAGDTVDAHTEDNAAQNTPQNQVPVLDLNQLSDNKGNRSSPNQTADNQNKDLKVSKDSSDDEPGGKSFDPKVASRPPTGLTSGKTRSVQRLSARADKSPAGNSPKAGRSPDRNSSKSDSSPTEHSAKSERMMMLPGTPDSGVLDSSSPHDDQRQRFSASNRRSRSNSRTKLGGYVSGLRTTTSLSVHSMGSQLSWRSESIFMR